MANRQATAHRSHWLMRSAVAAIVGITSIAHAGLYECHDASGAAIYTDSPAQLERCQPVASGGTSRLGLVGGASSSPAQTPDPVPSYQSPPMPPPMPFDQGSGGTTPMGGLIPSAANPTSLATGSSEVPPCLPGINPLNPLSGPPCPSSSAVPSEPSKP